MLPKKARIPAPFQRPSIELSNHGKTWQEVPASKIQGGDIIGGFGKVEERHDLLADENLVSVCLSNAISMETVTFAPDDVVRVFGPSRR